MAFFIVHVIVNYILIVMCCLSLFFPTIVAQRSCAAWPGAATPASAGGAGRGGYVFTKPWAMEK